MQRGFFTIPKGVINTGDRRDARDGGICKWFDSFNF
jgi:hypothetical protein